MREEFTPINAWHLLYSTLINKREPEELQIDFIEKINKS